MLNNRYSSLDHARGFTVLMIAPVHTVLIFANPEVYDSILVKFLTFIAEGPGAQLFMMLMGLYMAFSTRLTWRKILIRCSILFGTGIALNIAKFVLPSVLHLFPLNIYSVLQVSPNLNGWIKMALINDILSFAAVALPIVYAIMQKAQYEKVAISLAILIAFIAPFFWDYHSQISAIDYLLNLVGGHEPQTFFPLLPWLCYPLLGLSLGHYWKIYGEKTTVRHAAVIGILLIIASIIPASHLNENFYRTSAPLTGMHIGIVLVWLYLWHHISNRYPHLYGFKLLQWCSKNITLIYLIQWPLICWLIPVFGYQQLNYWQTWLAMLLTAAITFSLTYLFNRLKTFYAIRKQSRL